MRSTITDRRRFLATSAALAAAGAVGSGSIPSASAAELRRRGMPHQDTEDGLQGRIWKTLKIGMVKVEGSLTDQFKAVKAAGFDGIEMDAPGMDVEATRKAIAESGLPVDGTVNSTHWQIRHTDPDPEVRKRARESLEQAIRDTQAVGGHSVLLVAGHGRDGTPEECWQRALENIALSVPLAARYGVQIVIENVWNHFMYDHQGDHQQSADQYVRFVDALNSPWVGMQFDIGNHWKYGSMGDWIRQLGRRVYKLDIKGYSRAENRFTRISEGDIDYADVRKALKEINFYGWAAAEVSGGDQAELARIAGEMDVAFGLV